MEFARPVRHALFAGLLAAAVLVGASSALVGVCGPFTDVAADAFCPFVMEVFTLGITTGTTPTTYEPASTVSRLQMAAFLSRGVDGVLRRGSRRAAMKHFWTPQNGTVLGLTTVGDQPFFCAADGAEIWVSNLGSMSRVRANDGRLLETWTGFSGSPGEPLVAMGRVIVGSSFGGLYAIDARQAPGAPTQVATNLGIAPLTVAFDGAHVWTSNAGLGIGNGSVSILTPGSIPWTATTVTAGFSNPISVMYDGASIWITDYTLGTFSRLNGAGAILQTVTVGSQPNFGVFDGTNFWIPNYISNSVTVVRASNGAVLGTLTSNGLNSPTQAAFDGERVLVANLNGNVASLWKAADLTPIGFFQTGINTNPQGACSDGLNFWITLSNADKLARF